MNTCIYVILLSMAFNTLAQSDLSPSNCVSHQIILCFKEHPTTIAQTIQENPQCLAASPCIKRHPNSRFALYTSACGETTKELLNRFQNHPELDFCEPNYIKKTTQLLPPADPLLNIDIAPDNDPLFADQWYLHNTRQEPNSLAGADIDRLAARNMLQPISNRPPVIIAVIDSGFDIAHPQLANNLWHNPLEIPDNNLDDDHNGYIDDLHGFDFINQSSDLTVCAPAIAQHGSHVAALIAATPNDNHAISGILPNVQLILLRVSSDGTTIDNYATIQAYEYLTHLAQNGHPIIAANASYGGYYSYSTSEALTLHNMFLENIYLFAAAGNDNKDIDRASNHFYPATYPLSGIISVGATGPAHTKASFSNYGTNHVDIAAPGVDILSAIPLEREPQITIAENTLFTFRIHFTTFLPSQPLTAPLINCGFGRPQDFSPDIPGNIAFIQRGEITFKEKIDHAAAAGAIAVIIHNNSPTNDHQLIHDQWTYTESNPPNIPAIAITHQQAQTITPVIANQPIVTLQATINNSNNAYARFSGTSQATPLTTAAYALLRQLSPNRHHQNLRDDLLHHGITTNANLQTYVANSGTLNLLNAIDNDHDLIPDGWERNTFDTLEYFTPTTDRDNDGWKDYLEYYAGTNPWYSLSKPNIRTYSRIQPLFLTQYNKPVLQFSGFPNTTYTIQRKYNLSDSEWEDITHPLLSSGQQLELIDTHKNSFITPRKAFFRLKIESSHP